MFKPALLVIVCSFPALACSGDDDGGGGGGADAGGGSDARASADSGPGTDAGLDASVGCGDYQESADATNDSLVGGTAEATGITFAAGDTKVVCGVIDPAQMDAEIGVVDIDGFDFEVGDATPLRVVLRSPGGDELGGMAVLLQIVDTDGAATLSGGGFVDGYALATSAVVGAGTRRLAIFATPGDALPAGPIEYQAEITDRIPCDRPAGAADYTEAADGTRSRRNDTISATWANDPVTRLTTSTTDLPEPTDLTLEDGTPVHLRGTTADVAANDDYHDKDAYLVTAGEGVNEVDVRLTWPNGDIDMDVMAFIAGFPDNDIGAFGGAFIGTTRDENFTARIPADAALWVWAAAYNDAATDLPVDYHITVCPRRFTP